MIKTFLDWAKENNKSLPLLEKTRSAGISDNYPDAYAQKTLYPQSYFTPSSANAIGKLTGKMGS
jgi:hypothetical protein